MVALERQFDVNDDYVKQGIAQPHIPEGLYKAVIVNSELRDASSGGKYIALIVVLTEGQYANTELIERLNISNSNDIAVQIAYKTLASIAKAVGLTKTPSDTSELHNKPLIVDIKTEKGKDWTDRDGNLREGKDKSVIKGYKAVSGDHVKSQQSPAPASSGAAGNAPWKK